MLYVMKDCVIIHNMIIEDEWGVPGLEELTPANIDADLSPPSGVDDDGVNGDDAIDFQEFITRRFNMQSVAANSELRSALIENLWELEAVFSLVASVFSAITAAIVTGWLRLRK
ncbi:hypothetical protein PF005_g27577 [Phytophthora fragariae]|uniref:Uncharacterized protein n=1 Tax=Phytophthora fragariae TaxID=53985 RepID=A0A6A3W4H1_9STRA|nr:hypothetical protein PF003_g9636 [Phytophthora fragariae]KAE8921435.1 hypothetical protein PF009_g28289 [Phytophthora fragariae]KAE8970427.1 hypothetical protein PF011_g26422 [Phytophthora fragariae]KAE9069269.1 hypothetical protein PF007_g27385 [Phytophthora fragariae]KAE9082450.1 hypothetical protein PF006_g26905 [Phytophthora fragariae]